jgi:hypothetical protein
MKTFDKAIKVKKSHELLTGEEDDISEALEDISSARRYREERHRETREELRNIPD